MKFLADMGVSMTVVRTIRESGYDVVHLREEGLQRLADPAIILKARHEERIVLTFDLDFGDLLAASADVLPSVIIFRLQNTSPAFVAARLLETLSECGQALATGVILTVQDNRYRLRRLPIESVEN
jgi:predicted nuclease of predicted toxin-antitoxin system